MKRTSNAKCGELVAHLIPFKASNLHSEWVGEWYVVYSYGWYPILCAKPKGDRYYLRNDVKRYSASTQRQIMYVSKEIHAICDDMSIEQIKEFERPFQTVNR